MAKEINSATLNQLLTIQLKSNFSEEILTFLGTYSVLVTKIYISSAISG
jgi:hypothetical protein